MTLTEIEQMSVPERVLLVEDIWDSIAQSTDEIPIPQWQRDELARRRAAYLREPTTVRSWPEVRDSILRQQ